MGLDTTHDCWHGAYSAFHRWRAALARMAGVPLMLMEGYYKEPDPEALKWIAPRDGGPMCGSYFGPALHYWFDDVLPSLPIKWESLKPDVLHVLLNHSDCGGSIPAAVCGPLADRLAELALLFGEDEDGGGHIGLYRDKTMAFVEGLRAAAAAGEDVEFH